MDLQRAGSINIEIQRSSTKLVAALLATHALIGLNSSPISPALPALREHFSGIPGAELWVGVFLTLPAFFIAIGAPLAGWMFDRLGRKPVLVAAVVLYGLAGSSGLLLDSLLALAASRALLGLAAGGISTGVMTVIADYFSGEQRTRMLGYQSAVGGLSSALFASMGGLLAETSWRLPFSLYLLAFLALPLTSLVLIEPPRQVAERSSRADRAVETGEAAGAAGSRNFNRSWMVPVGVIYGLAFLLNALVFVVPVHLPFFLPQIGIQAARQSGFALSVITLSYAVGASLAGALHMRLGRQLTIVAGMFLAGLGFALVGMGWRYAAVLAGLSVSGLGLGWVVPVLRSWLASLAPLDLRGRSLGVLNTFHYLGRFASPLLSQPVAGEMGPGAVFLFSSGLTLLIGMGGLLAAPLLRESVVESS